MLCQTMTVVHFSASGPSRTVALTWITDRNDDHLNLIPVRLAHRFGRPVEQAV